MSADIPNRKPKTARHRAAAVVSMLLVAAGCSQPTQKTPVKVVPTSSTQAAELPTATLENGFVVNLELAITPEEVANGLMFRPSLPTDRGMLFIFDVERQPSFWMKNTLIPLDLFFLDSLGKVVDIVADAQPCAADPCPTYTSEELARAVLELAAGSAAAQGIQAGAVINFDKTPGYPVEAEPETDEDEEP
jgi:uncharacterized membrane protein (UPF0127 family)